MKAEIEIEQEQTERTEKKANLFPPLFPPLPPVESPPALFLRWRGYGVKFHRNLCGCVYSLVADADATRFTDPAEAMALANKHHIPWTECVLVIP